MMIVNMELVLVPINVNVTLVMKNIQMELAYQDVIKDVLTVNVLDQTLVHAWKDTIKEVMRMNVFHIVTLVVLMVFAQNQILANA